MYIYLNSNIVLRQLSMLSKSNNITSITILDKNTEALSAVSEPLSWATHLIDKVVTIPLEALVVTVKPGTVTDHHRTRKQL